MTDKVVGSRLTEDEEFTVIPDEEVCIICGWSLRKYKDPCTNPDEPHSYEERREFEKIIK